MGYYSALYVDKYPLDSSKYGVTPELTTIFTESDKFIIKHQSHELDEPRLWAKYNDESDEPINVIIYQASVQNTIKRLEVMGFTLSHCREYYEEAKHYWIEEFLGAESEVSALLRNTKFESLIETFKEIKGSRFGEKYIQGDRDKVDSSNLSPLAKYMLIHNDEVGYWFGFPWHDIRILLRAFLESCPKESRVIIDITDLVLSGDFEAEYPLCDAEKKRLVEDFEVNTKIIILTEGSSDAQILRAAMDLLYSDLKEYYAFMDFHGSNSEGGAGALVSQIKSFAGAKIANRVIALFDNDTAAYLGKRGLKNTDIPDNIKILTLPKLELATNYPTMGPGGITNMDINGLAGSIELYLGEDVLKENHEYIPIQWKGYNETLKQYHGEVANKKKIHERYFRKIKKCKNNNDLIKDFDFSGIELILEHIFKAFG